MSVTTLPFVSTRIYNKKGKTGVALLLPTDVQACSKCTHNVLHYTTGILHFLSTDLKKSIKYQGEHFDVKGKYSQLGFLYLEKQALMFFDWKSFN